MFANSCTKTVPLPTSNGSEEMGLMLTQPASMNSLTVYMPASSIVNS